MEPQIKKLDDALLPGLTSLTWMSGNLDQFVAVVNSNMEDLDTLINHANDLLECRIYALFNEMQDITLCELPSSDPWTVDHFVKNTEVSLCG